MTSGRHHRRGAPGCTGRRGGGSICSCTKLGRVVEELPDVEQLELPIAELVTGVVGDTIQQRFESFHQLNPWVYDALCQLTEDWIRRGRTRIGIKMLTEVLRWQHGRRTTGDEFRLNNTYTSRYARLLIEHHPEWADVFQIRELKAS